MARRTVPAPLAALPNALTIARLAVIPVFAGLLLTADGGRSWLAGSIWAAAGATDQIDGFLARRWHVESAFGKIADPLADRLLIAVGVVLLWHAGRLPWVALLIPVRDVALIALTPLMLSRGYRFEVNFLGKVATWGFYLSLGCVMVTHPSTRWPIWLFWTSVGLAVVSLLLYARKARQEIAVQR